MLDFALDIQKTRAYIQDIDEFQNGSMAARAILFDLIQIGELCGKMSEEFRLKNPQFNLAEPKGLRNFIVHDYDGLVPLTIDHTIHQSIDDFILVIQRCLSHEVDEPSLEN